MLRRSSLVMVGLLVLGGCSTYTIPSEQVMETPTEQVIPVAERGDLGAVHTLCYRYTTGTSNTPVDYERAHFWCGRGAAHGNPTSQFILGELYYYGLGRPRDIQRAVDEYARAASQGWPPAMFTMYELLLAGDGVRRDERAAVGFLERAAEQNYAPAVEALRKRRAAGTQTAR